MRIIATLIVLAGSAMAQPAFDVASVKPDASETGVDRINISKGSLIIRNVSLRRLINMAYGIPDSREYLLTGPDWLDTERFDISAKYPLSTSDPDVLQMLQRLLGERFSLTLHRETRQISGYALMIGKNGPKLRPAASSRPFANFRALSTHAEGTSVSMPDLADRLSRPPFQLERPVVDSTGLTGRFDLTLDWSPIDKPAENAAAPSIVSAIEEQLGLRLEARKMPLEVLIVDHADRVPAAN
jgi:uncharacterized protein (TIGR03435 family)